jgi:hypothetical protein
MESGQTLMRCRYCNTALAPSRSFVDGEFCCDDHRQEFETDGLATASLSQQVSPPITQSVSTSVTTALAMLRGKFGARSATTQVEAMDPEAPAALEAISDTAESHPESYPEVEEGFAEETASTVPHPARETAASWQWLNAAWKGAPRDLKLVTLLLPILLVVAITGSIPKVPIQQLAPQNLDKVQGQVQQVVFDHWKNLNQTISDRAAVSYADDFRSGLDAWESRSNLTRSWSYDVAGFVRPGPLAIFKPTVDLTDYNFEFLGEIDQKALGWAFRAEDLNNYYAMKFVVVKPGPLPLVHMVRYAVINGKEGPHIDKPLPMTVRTDMLYRIQVSARGSDFTIMAQGQVVDFWSDSRLSHGGVGFFCNRGERARLRWVEVSHQYDALGRLCAYLAPYGIEGRNGSIN